MESADLMSIGQHCAVADCRQRDFLPFTCDCCEKAFCLEHRTYTAHSCQKANKATSSTVICPICARAVKIQSGQDPNVVFEEHTARDCDPNNYAKVMNKQKCPVPGCKEKLNSINTYTCKNCTMKVCMKHRFPEDHSCSRAPLQQQGKSWPSAALQQLFNLSLAPTRVDPRGQREGPLQIAARSSTSRPVDSQTVVRPQSQQAPTQSVEEEVCPICNARFPSVSDLIAHSSVHTTVEVAAEICPHCQASFADAVALVDHVERQHSSKSTCVLS